MIYYLDVFISKIKSFGKKVSVVLNFVMFVYMIENVFGIVDMVLVMIVNFGYGG